MNKIGLSFYLSFLVLVGLIVVGVATLAEAPEQALVPGGAAAVPAAQQVAAETERRDGPQTRGERHAAAPQPTGAGSPESPEKLDEPAYRAALAKIVAPLAELEIPEAEAKALAELVKALRRRDLDKVQALKKEIGLAAGQMLVEWNMLRSGFGRPEEFRKFLDNNPMWPDRRLLRRRLEQALFIDGGSAKGILAHFASNDPETDAGLAAKASAHLALGDVTVARKLAAQAWCGGGIAASRERAFLNRFGAHLTKADHKCRFDRYLVANLRWTSARRRRAAAARRLVRRLDAAEQAKAKARLAAFLRQRSAGKALDKIPAAQAKDDWGFAFQRVQHLRRSRKHAAAWKLLKSVPTDPAKIINPDAWWEERHANALNALRQKRITLAYDLVAEIRPDGVNPGKDQAFFAAWLALRKRDDAKLALDHFKRMRRLADGPLSTSKSEYWLGRTYAALGKTELARAHFENGAKKRDTFHGLLSRQAVAPDDSSLELPLPALPGDEAAKRFLQNPVVQAAVIAHKVGLPRSHVLKFFRAIARKLETEAEIAMLAQLANALGDGQLEVRTGKTGVSRGFNMYIYSYPIGALPKYKPLRQPPERALVLAIARQESEFNKAIVSGAGARGIMQVMPITAKHVCRDYKIKCRIPDLLTKPDYNAQIATAYIADRKDEFGGSYILTFTGYNAGPGRTRQWLRKIGDPRSPKVEPLDWIYRIPFEETRKYAQKVLSNVQVYRARLGEDNPLRLQQDMNRAKKRS